MLSRLRVVLTHRVLGAGGGTHWPAGPPFWGGSYPPFLGVFVGYPFKNVKNGAPGSFWPPQQILVHQFCKKSVLWSRKLSLEQSWPLQKPYFLRLFQALFTPPTFFGLFLARNPAASLRKSILKCDIRGWYNSSAKSNFWGFLGFLPYQSYLIRHKIDLESKAILCLIK